MNVLFQIDCKIGFRLIAQFVSFQFHSVLPQLCFFFLRVLHPRLASVGYLP